MNEYSCRLCIVDDDVGHVRLIEKKLRRCGISNTIEVFGSGPELLDYFEKNLSPGDRPIVLLDLNMPGMSGQQVLRTLRSHISTRLLPVIILTSSCDPREIQECLALGCNSFITKPIQLDELAENLHRIGFGLNIFKDDGHPVDAC